MKTGLYKAGFVVKSIDKYIHLLSFVGKSFVVYQYNRKSNIEDVEEVFRYNGEKNLKN